MFREKCDQNGHLLGFIPYTSFCLFDPFTDICNVKHGFMALKRVAELNGNHSPTVGRKYKSRYWIEIRHWDLSSDPINFSYWHMKGYFFKGYIYQKIDFTLFGLEIVVLNQLVDTKMQKKRDFQQKNEVFNQLAECRNRKLTCINYHLKWRFHTVQENIHQFSDINDLFGPIVIYPDSSIELVVAVLYGWSGYLTFSIIYKYYWSVSQICQSFKFIQNSSKLFW